MKKDSFSVSPAMMETAGADVGLKKGRFTWTTIRSPLYDSVFFLFPFWFSIAYGILLAAMPQYSVIITLLAFAFLAETHFGSTWGIYLDPENRRYFSQHPGVYYYIPALIFLACLGVAGYFGVRILVLLIAPISIYHITRQSVGVMALYRIKSGERDLKLKKIEDATLYLASITFAGYLFARFFVANFAPLQGTALGENLTALAFAVSHAFAVVSFLAFLWALSHQYRRYQKGENVSVAKLIVFLYSALLYSPNVFVSRPEYATIMGVGIHYLQYVGLMWLMNIRKNAEVKPESIEDRRHGFLVYLSRNSWARMAALGVYGLVMLSFRQNGFNFQSLDQIGFLFAIPIGLNAIHFFVDGFIWRFSNPYYRKTVLPYIT